jgi:nucleotide-binding universal stress UspA family protein
MSYAALMVYVEPDEAPEGRVRLAAGLADKFGAALIGLSARSIAPPILANGLMMPAAPDINALQRQLADRGSWFGRIADSDRRKTEWRSALELANQMVTREARSADLVVIGQTKGWASKFHPLDPGAALLTLAKKERADLLVTGAYGHTRLGEWIFGGMTRELLATSPICCLMSH